MWRCAVAVASPARNADDGSGCAGRSGAVAQAASNATATQAMRSEQVTMIGPVRRRVALLRLHADRAVEPDRLAVEHRRSRRCGAPARRTRRARRAATGTAPACRASPAPPAACRAASACRTGRARWSRTRMPLRDEVARDRQRHADDAALGGRVGGLADLAVEGGDRGGVDDARRARRSAVGSCLAIASAARRIMLKVPIRLMLMTRANDASACGPSLPTTFSPMAMPAQLTRPRSGSEMRAPRRPRPVRPLRWRHHT